MKQATFFYIFFIFAQVLVAIKPVQAQELIDASIPLFSQKMGFKVKKGWKAGHQQQTANVFLLELIQANEEISSWTQMLAISAYKDMAAKLSALEAYKIEADSVVKNCPADAINSIVKQASLQGYDSVSAIVGCGKHPVIKGKNEVAFYTFIKAKTDIYMIKKAFRENLNSDPSTRLSEATYKTMAPEVLAVKICKNDKAGPTCIEEAM